MSYFDEFEFDYYNLWTKEDYFQYYDYEESTQESRKMDIVNAMEVIQDIYTEESIEEECKAVMFWQYESEL